MIIVFKLMISDEFTITHSSPCLLLVVVDGLFVFLAREVEGDGGVEHLLESVLSEGTALVIGHFQVLGYLLDLLDH